MHFLLARVDVGNTAQRLICGFGCNKGRAMAFFREQLFHHYVNAIDDYYQQQQQQQRISLAAAGFYGRDLLW